MESNPSITQQIHTSQTTTIKAYHKTHINTLSKNIKNSRLTLLFTVKYIWWAVLGSNQRPPRCQRGTLTS